MTTTTISSATREVHIGFDQPFVIIGERINPTGRKILAEEMKNGDYSRVEADALAQVEAGAHMLDVNAGIPLADEPRILAEAVQLVQSITDVPLSIDSSIVEALEAGLAVYQGKALVNSVTGEDEVLDVLGAADLEHIGEAHDVGVHVGRGLARRVTYPGLGGQVEHPPCARVLEGALQESAVTDIAAKEGEGLAGGLLKAGLLQTNVVVIVQVVDPDHRLAAGEERAGDVVTDKAGGARDEDGRHHRLQ